MKRTVVWAAAAAVVLSASISAQGRNFSGTWTVDTEKTMAAAASTMTAGGGGGGGRGGAIVARSGGGGGGAAVASSGTVAVAGGGGGGRGGAIARGAGGATGPVGTVLTIDANSFTIAQGQSTTSYKTDGSVTSLDTETRKASAKAAWQGDKLVIETTTQTPNGPVVSWTTWYLEGESLVRESKSTSSDGQEVVRKTFFKKGTN